MVIGIRLLTVADYHRMAEVGIFDPEERLELIAGQIIQMSAKGTAHSAATTRTAKLLNQQLGERVLVRLQEPIQLDNYSEPEPDIAVVMPNPLYYDDHHPTPDEVFFLIEIADTSLKYDTENKAKIYAKSGIQDYWVLDVSGRKLHVYRLPNSEGYQSEMIISEDVTISPLAFPDCVILVREMLRPLMNK
ncbi:MAG: Uma2 family endonuclease [Nostocaceae cyanobacterium]|nr:Uma2 family endonuclease [Nostocaceae cyanobacterium]